MRRWGFLFAAAGLLLPNAIAAQGGGLDDCLTCTEYERESDSGHLGNTEWVHRAFVAPAANFDYKGHGTHPFPAASSAANGNCNNSHGPLGSCEDGTPVSGVVLPADVAEIADRFGLRASRVDFTSDAVYLMSCDGLVVLGVLDRPTTADRLRAATQATDE